MRTKLCEHVEVKSLKSCRKLTNRKSLEEWWYSWTTVPEAVPENYVGGDKAGQPHMGAMRASPLPGLY